MMHYYAMLNRTRTATRSRRTRKRVVHVYLPGVTARAGIAVWPAAAATAAAMRQFSD